MGIVRGVYYDLRMTNKIRVSLQYKILNNVKMPIGVEEIRQSKIVILGHQVLRHDGEIWKIKYILNRSLVYQSHLYNLPCAVSV